MGKVRIVVDSSADFPVHSTVDRHRLTVVPHTIHFGKETYLDGQTMDAEAFFRRASKEDVYPRFTAPTVEQFVEVYKRLARETDQILSLHVSRTLSDSWKNAKAAAETLLGRCKIEVIDTLTASAGVGLLADRAAKIAEKEPSLEEIVRLVRGDIGRVYSIYFVDSLDYLREKGLLGEAQTILGTMLGIKPFLTIEDGHLVTMEKVRTRVQAIDKLIEFVLEFGGIDQLVILQNTPIPTETIRILQDRLVSELGHRDFQTILYGPVIGCQLGLDATGIVVVESEEYDELDEDDFPEPEMDELDGIEDDL